MQNPESSRQFIQSSMQNMESVDHKITELPLDTPETPLLTPLTKKKSHNLLGQSVRTFMQNLESVAQKKAELLHNYVIIT